MTTFRNVTIRKQIKLLERRRDHLTERNKGSWDVSEAAALGVAIEAIKEKYPERPETKPVERLHCGMEAEHGMHIWAHQDTPYSCGGYSD